MRLTRTDSLLTALARVLSDASYRHAILGASEEDHARFGLRRDELRIVLSLDRGAIARASGSFAGKRLEAVSHVYPWTTDLITRFAPGLRARYAESIPAAGQGAEIAQFATFVRGATASARDINRLLRDTLELETAMAGWVPTPLTPAVPGPDAKLWRAARMVVLSGPIDLAVAALAAGEAVLPYRERSGSWLVGGRVQFRSLEPREERLWEMLGDIHRFSELPYLAGQDRATLQEWLDNGLIRPH